MTWALHRAVSRSTHTISWTEGSMVGLEHLHDVIAGSQVVLLVCRLMTSLEGTANCVSRIGAALAEADALQHVAARLQPDDGEDAADAEQVTDGQMTAALILERLARGGDK